MFASLVLAVSGAFRLRLPPMIETMVSIKLCGTMVSVSRKNVAWRSRSAYRARYDSSEKQLTRALRIRKLGRTVAIRGPMRFIQSALFIDQQEEGRALKQAK